MPGGTYNYTSAGGGIVIPIASSLFNYTSQIIMQTSLDGSACIEEVFTRCRKISNTVEQ